MRQKRARERELGPTTGTGNEKQRTLRKSRSCLKDRNTDPSNRNLYIAAVEETYNFTSFSIQVCLRDIFSLVYAKTVDSVFRAL